MHKAQRGQYVKISVCVWVCVVTSNFYIIDEVIEVDEIDKANISAAAAKKDKYWKGELSYAILKHKKNKTIMKMKKTQKMKIYQKIKTTLKVKTSRK